MCLLSRPRLCPYRLHFFYCTNKAPFLLLYKRGSCHPLSLIYLYCVHIHQLTHTLTLATKKNTGGLKDPMLSQSALKLLPLAQQATSSCPTCPFLPFGNKKEQPEIAEKAEGNQDLTPNYSSINPDNYFC